MGALPVIQFFRLSEDGVRCGADGLHVGPTPLLRRAASGNWEARPRDEVEAELTVLYGLPIDLSGKAGGLATVARALERGDAALAAIAAVLLGFPDPPGLAKDAPARGSVELAAQLCRQRAAQGLGSGEASARRRQAEPRLVRRQARRPERAARRSRRSRRSCGRLCERRA